MVPTLSILFMSMSGIISVCLPVGAYIFWRKKYDLKIVPLLYGAAAFLLFAMVLEQIMHTLVLRPGQDGMTTRFDNSPALYVLYGIFAAGIFEETARFLSFMILKNKHRGFGTALSYGIGHGGIEAILLMGMASLSNVAVMTMINESAGDALIEAGIAAETITLFIESNPGIFLVGALERLFAVTIHISLSVLVWYSVMRRGMTWLFPSAILLHAAANLPAALMQTGLIESLVLTETLVGLGALAIAVLTVYIVKMYGTEPEEVGKG